MDNEKNFHASKLFDTIKKYSSGELAQKIAHDKPLSASCTTEQCTEWVNYVSQQLEANFDEQTIKLIRQDCYCREDGKLDENKKWLSEIYQQSSDVPDFVNRVNTHGAGWYMQDGELYTTYVDCSCPMLEGVELLTTKTWCHCTAGFVKEIFGDVFGYEVDAEIIKSIKMGDELCLIKISRKDGLQF